MKKTRTLPAATVVLLLVAALLPAGAGATPYQDGKWINAYPTYVYTNGLGQYNIRYSPQNTNTYYGESRFYFPGGSITDGAADNGLNLAVYDDSSLTSATLYGFKGTPFTADGAHPVALSGSGVDINNPRVLTSQYFAGTCPGPRCLHVTESEQYVNGAQTVRIVYDVQNQSNDSSTVYFRATAGGDVVPGGSEGGAGRYIDPGTPASPELVGTINQNYGVSMDLQEVTGGDSNWSAHMEDTPYNIWRKVTTPTGSGLTNEPTTTNAYGSDKAVAIQWDTYRAAGLAAGSTAHFQVLWHFDDYDSLSVPDPGGYVATGTPVTASATATNDDGSLTDLDDSHPAGAPLSYRTDAYSHNVLTANGAWLGPVTPTGSGTADVSYTGDNAGYDTLQTWVDTNHDGVVQPNEPQRNTYVSWFNEFDFASGFSDYYDYTGQQATARVSTKSALNVGQPQSFEYEIKDKDSGAQQVPLSIPLMTDVGGVYDIHWTRYTGGNDRVYIYTDTGPTPGYGNDPGETRTWDVEWDPRIYTYPEADEVPTDSTRSVYIYTTTPVGGSYSGTPRYWVTDENDARISGFATDQDAPATTTGTSQMMLSSATAGQRRYYFYIDDNANGVWDDGSGAAAREPLTVVTIDWIVPLTQRLQFGTYTYDRTIGGPAQLTATLLDDSGAALAGKTVRYKITGLNPAAEQPAGSATDAQGHVTIDWTGTNTPPNTYSNYDSVEAYADLNGNDVQDNNEPSDYAAVAWHPSVEISTANPVYVPTTATATIYLRDIDGTLYNPLGGYSYSIIGTHGPLSASGLTPPSFSPGVASISWPSLATTVTGSDTLTVSANTLPENGGSGPQTDEQAEAVVEFKNQLRLTPEDQTVKANGTTQASVTPLLTHDFQTRTYHWSVTGANASAQPGDHTATAPCAGCSGPAITLTGTEVGDETMTVWVDQNGNGTYDAGTDWSNASVIHWSPDLLQVTGNTDYTTGADAQFTATWRDNLGDPVSGETIAWTINGDNTQYGKLAADTDSNGEVSISWNGANTGYDTLVVWEDADHNGVKDSGEATKTLYVQFHDPLERTSQTSYGPEQGAGETVGFTLRDLAYQPIQGTQLKYRITGANPHGPANVAQPTDGNGRASVTWTGDNYGQDTLTVWDDSGATPDVVDPGERVATVYVNWYPRVAFNHFSPWTINVGQGPATVTASIYDVTGSSVPNAHLLYRRVGPNPLDLTATTADGQGNASFSWDSTTAGSDTLTVTIDADNDGVVDPGEFSNTFEVDWHAAIGLAPAYTQKYATGQQSISVTLNGVTGAATKHVRWYVSGANHTSSQTDQLYGSGFNVVLHGDLPGVDILNAYIDDNANGQHDSGEASAAAEVDWLPRVTLGSPSGSLVVGAQTTIPVQLLDVNGVPMAATPIKWRVIGATANNDRATTSDSTNGSGNATVQYTASDSGTDTVQVWADTVNANGLPDPGEPQNTAYVGWAPPPVALGASPGTATKLQGNPQSVVVTLTGTPGGDAGRTIRWSVAGANAQTGVPQATDGAGQATLTWTGANDGSDTVSAYADVSGASGTRDNFDPVATAKITWEPLVQLSSTTSSQSIGETHTETVHFVDSSGAPLTDTAVIYSISGANPTAGQIVARPIGSATGARIQARTDTSGNASISWTGANTGTDTLDVWADANGNGIVDATEPHASKTVTWGTASAAATGTPGTGVPTGSSSAVVPPGSVNDLDGLPSPPPPVVAKAVNVSPVSGTVLVKLPGKKGFVDLLDAEQVPVGSIVDVTKGRVALTSAQNLKGGVATAQFYLGQFQIAQKKAAKPITDLNLFGGSFKGCPKIARKSSGAAQKKKVRQLWGSGKGLFRTKGKYASAQIRGTTWDVVDYCDGTLVKVTQGLVTVHDNVKNADVTVKAPKSYFAPAKRK